MRTLCRSLLLFVVMAAGATDDARADQRAARRHFRQAETHFRLGRFQEALDAYSQAYEAAELPAFLFNIAQCHMELKQYERAQFFYEQFLREKPRSKNRPLVEERLAEAKAALLEEAERQAARVAQERLAAERRSEEERLRLEQERLAEERLAAERAANEKAAEEKRAALARPVPMPTATGGRAVEEPIYARWWFWTAVGGLVAAGTTATILLTPQRTETVLPAGPLGTIVAP